MNIVDELLKVALFGSAWVLWLLLALSVLSLGIMAERLVFFWRNGRGGGDALRERLLAALRAGDDGAARAALRDSHTVEGDVVAEAFVFLDGGSAAFLSGLESAVVVTRRELERGTNFLGTVGNNAPFIGLLGTVIGVIVAFQELGTAEARQGAMGNVMAGIAEALVATGVGLFVAIPAVIAYNVLQVRIGAIESEITSLGRLVAGWLDTRAHGATLRAPEDVVAPTAPSEG
jgi:biopolymer transport protein ExbB/TolQ